MKTTPVSHYDIIVHCPKTEAGLQKLSEQVAAVHVQAVMEKLSSLSCPVEQKSRLIDEVIKRNSKTGGGWEPSG